MRIIAFNGSPRKNGNTSAIIRSILEGAASTGAETTEVLLHHIDMKGCMGCLSCNEKHGQCAQKDALKPYLDEMKRCDGVVFGCPIYMYRIAGQMKLLVDRLYSFYIPQPEGGYKSALPPGKRFAMVISQGAEEPDQYKKSARWLAGMAGTGLGMAEVGRISHINSHIEPARSNDRLLEEARAIGRRLAGRD
ncbi:MAG: flavodoxin family protein [bacterium]